MEGERGRKWSSEGGGGGETGREGEMGMGWERGRERGYTAMARIIAALSFMILTSSEGSRTLCRAAPQLTAGAVMMEGKYGMASRSPLSKRKTGTLGLYLRSTQSVSSSLLFSSSRLVSSRLVSSRLCSFLFLFLEDT